MLPHLKFLVDESSGRKLFEFLLEKGFDTKFVTNEIPAASDKEVLSLAEKENRILITNDKDFGELIFRLNKQSSGVILLRLNFDSSENRQKIILNLIENIDQKLRSSFIVANEKQVRVRQLGV